MPRRWRWEKVGRVSPLRAGPPQTKDGAHGVTRPTNLFRRNPTRRAGIRSRRMKALEISAQLPGVCAGSVGEVEGAGDEGTEV